jgi:hypothetical protein
VYTKDEKKELTHLFWTSFDGYCTEQGFLSGRKKIWMLHRTKVSHVQLKFCLEKGSVMVAIEITHKNEEERLEMFEKIEACKAIIEEGFNNGLSWDFAFEKENRHEVCRIFDVLIGYDYLKTEDWEPMFCFMANSMYLLEHNFLEIRDILNETWQ